jgi:regulator of cell morphogenesis and NO signaling
MADIETLSSNDLIQYILDRFHAVHRADVPAFLELAERVAAQGDPRFPAAILGALAEAGEELESHMQKEEQILFPLMEAGGHPMIGCPITQMRVEHDEHSGRIAALEALTNNLTTPADASTEWALLYKGIAKLLADLRAHIHAENDVLFPRFAIEDQEAA